MCSGISRRVRPKENDTDQELEDEENTEHRDNCKNTEAGDFTTNRRSTTTETKTKTVRTVALGSKLVRD
jgi:hypothetical protein